MKDKKYIYKGNRFLNIDISPINYKSDFFKLELDLESEVFYEIRKLNNIIPNKINENSKKDLNNIKKFFNKNKNSFYFLFHENGELIGSILHLKNYIQSLSISKKYQKQGFGEKLLKYCINQILNKGFTCVELNVLNGNTRANHLFKKIGFVEVK